MSLPKATSILQTCEACPSQWEGKLEDGRMFYARYRWGCFYISVSPSATDNVSDAVTNEYLIEIEHGGDWDGVMATEEMMELSKGCMDWSLVK